MDNNCKAIAFSAWCDEVEDAIDQRVWVECEEWYHNSHIADLWLAKLYASQAPEPWKIIERGWRRFKKKMECQKV